MTQLELPFPSEPGHTRTAFMHDLREVLVKHSVIKLVSPQADLILARYLMACLTNLRTVLNSLD